MSSEIDDKELIKQYLQGDEKSLEILIKRHLKPIYGFVYRNIGDATAAEDVAQEVFMKVWKNLKKFDQNKNFKPWIFQIAKNATIDYLRKKKTIPFSKFENERGQNLLAENIVSKQPDLIGALSDKRASQAILEKLSNRDRNIIDLRHLQGMSFNEIAQISRESVNTIKSRYRRIILSLRQNIKK